MTRSPYDWNNGKPAIIKQHSLAKHAVLRAYLIEYLQTLVVSPHQQELKLTLIDGFAGGGVYTHEATRVEVLGSPFVMLDAVRDAEAIINLERTKPVRMNVDYFFVERDPSAHASLLHALRARDYGPRLDADIRVLNTGFETQVEAIRRFVATKSPRVGRSIFFLDQYGYSDVPTSLIRTIFDELSAAEVILTFNVDALINYASDNGKTQKLLDGIGVPDVLRGRTIDDIKANESDYRLYIQSCLYRDLVAACGADFYTVFFIRSAGHGDYWLVHLSQHHHRARDVMTQVHWTQNNHFIHYGGAGLQMFQALGYDPVYDGAARGQTSLAFQFDDMARTASVAALSTQLPRIIYATDEGISFGQLFSQTCNASPADSHRYKEALELLVQQKDIQIIGPDGARRLKASTITDKDQLVPAAQTTFGFGR